MKKTIIIIIAIILLLAIIGNACGDNDYTAKDLEDAKGRYFTGNATQQDKTMVEGFYKWKAKQQN